MRLVRNDEALAEYSKIMRSGLPVFYFSELEMLRGKTAEELKVTSMAKAVLPAGLVPR